MRFLLLVLGGVCLICFAIGRGWNWVSKCLHRRHPLHHHRVYNYGCFSFLRERKREMLPPLPFAGPTNNHTHPHLLLTCTCNSYFLLFLSPTSIDLTRCIFKAGFDSKILVKLKETHTISSNYYWVFSSPSNLQFRRILPYLLIFVQYDTMVKWVNSQLVSKISSSFLFGL